MDPSGDSLNSAVGIFFTVCGISACTPTISALLSRYASPSEQGTTLGINQSLQSFARVVGPLVWGKLFDEDPGLPFIAAGGAALLLSVISYIELTLNRQLPEHVNEVGETAISEMKKAYSTELEALKARNVELVKMLRCYEAMYGPLQMGGARGGDDAYAHELTHVKHE